MTKLYKNISRFAARRNIPTPDWKKLKWAAKLKPGDIVNNCSGFNVKIINIEPHYIFYRNGWYVYDFVFQTTPYMGFCSLIACGVDLAKPRDLIESRHLKLIKGYIDSGRMDTWYGSAKDSEEYKNELKYLSNQIEALQNKIHITNEYGMLLEEYCLYPNNYKS